MIEDNCIHMLLCLFGACFGLKAIQPENIHIKFIVVAVVVVMAVTA